MYTRYTVHGRGAKRVTLTGDKSVWILSPRQVWSHSDELLSVYVPWRTVNRNLGFWAKKNSKSVKKVDKKRGPRTSISYSLKLVNDPLFLGSRKIVVSTTSRQQHVGSPQEPVPRNFENLTRTNGLTNELTEIQIKASTNNKALRAIMFVLQSQRSC